MHNSNGYFSKWEEVQHGVPRDSVLGPLLFLIHVNGLSNVYLTNPAQFYLLMT